MTTMGLDECAALLRCDRETVRELAARGELPGAQVGSAWVFIESDVLAWLRRRIEDQQRLRADRLRGVVQYEGRLTVSKATRRRVPPALPELPRRNA